jgi:hypothetical protein
MAPAASTAERMASAVGVAGGRNQSAHHLNLVRGVSIIFISGMRHPVFRMAHAARNVILLGRSAR